MLIWEDFQGALYSWKSNISMTIDLSEMRPQYLMFAVEIIAGRVEQMQNLLSISILHLLLPCPGAAVSRWAPWKMGHFTLASFHLQLHYTILSEGNIKRWLAEKIDIHWQFNFLCDSGRKNGPSDQV